MKKLALLIFIPLLSFGQKEFCNYTHDACPELDKVEIKKLEGVSSVFQFYLNNKKGD